VEAAWLQRWRNGQRCLPLVPDASGPDQVDARVALKELLDDLDEAHPLAAFLGATARSYQRALDMLDARGTPGFVAHSRALYGHPRDPVVPGVEALEGAQPVPTHLDAAHAFLTASAGCDIPSPLASFDDQAAAAWLDERIQPLFDKPLRIELDPDLPSLATAGSRRIRLRAGARFSEQALRQLLEHEALVHTATKRSGKAQPLLSSLGLSSPRTTAAQEGLATVAELITDTMDLIRLRRVALRIVAVDAALEGADFLDVFEILRAGGQPAEEAFRSAARVFRGGDVRGKVAFTKDVVYLRGMARVHTFLLAALRDHHPALPARLFAGRMTLGDALRLEPFFDDGTLKAARVLPTWVTELSSLAAYLAWSAFSTRIPVAEVSLEDFMDSPD